MGSDKSTITKCINIASMIFNSPSLLTRNNLSRIKTSIRLFGFRIAFREVAKKLWQDNYFLYGGIRSIRPKKDKKRPEDDSVHFENITVSVVIPVKNAGEDLQHLLSAIKNQKGFKDVETIVVDSGSTDKSIEISKKVGAKIIQILPGEFSHSHARNLGAELATGDYVLFTVQDALPPSEFWLYELFITIKENDVAAVSCAEIPREDADLFYRGISWRHSNFMEIENHDRIMCKPEIENHLSLQKNGQLNNIACLISRQVFMKYRFRGRYAEELDLGIRLIRDGYRLAIISSTRIIHSHNRPAYYYLKRGYVEHMHLSKILPNYPEFPVDFEQLICEIVFNYKLLRSILYREPKELDLPCTVKELSSFIIHGLYNPRKNCCCDTIDTDSNRYIDNKFRIFLDGLMIQKNYHVRDDLALNGIFLDKMQSYMSMILEFTYNNYENIDHKLLEEFNYCLFKTYAFICGMQLASSYIKYSGEEDQKYREINDELTQYL